MVRRAHSSAAGPPARQGEPRTAPPLVSWTRVGALCGFVAGASYALASAVPATSALGVVAASVFGPALVALSAGLYHVLRAHRRTVTLDFGIMANFAAGVTVTLMLFTQLALNQWFELQFGTGSADSSERALRAGFEAANGIQLGLDLAWDLFLALGVVLLALNMWQHPRFGRLFAISGSVLAIVFIVLNLTAFPEPPEHSGSIDLGPVIGLWYVIVTVRLAMSGRWAAAHEVADA